MLLDVARRPAVGVNTKGFAITYSVLQLFQSSCACWVKIGVAEI